MMIFYNPPEFRPVVGFKECGSGDEGIGTGLAAEGAGVGVDAAVDFDAKGQLAVGSPLVDC